MANANTAFGLAPINQNGDPWSGQGRMYAVPTGQAANIFKGDPVVPLGGTDAFGVPLVGIASAGGSATVLGAMMSICNGPQGSGVVITQDLPTYRVASVANYILVADDPNQLYAIQEDSVGGAMAAASVGYANADLVAGSGSTTTGLSGWQLDSSTLQTTSTLQLRIIGLLRAPDNAVGVNAKWVVRINLPALWAASGY